MSISPQNSVGPLALATGLLTMLLAALGLTWSSDLVLGLFGLFFLAWVLKRLQQVLPY